MEQDIYFIIQFYFTDNAQAEFFVVDQFIFLEISRHTINFSIRSVHIADGFFPNSRDFFSLVLFWSYLFFLRLVPLFPFWLVNLVPAFLGVGYGVYAVTTFIGIIPGALVYASIGSGLGMVFDQGETPDLGIIFDPQILLPLLGLGLLALLPVLYKKRQSAKN